MVYCIFCSFSVSWEIEGNIIAVQIHLLNTVWNSSDILPSVSLKAAWLSWLMRLSSKQEMVSSKLTVALFLAAKYQMAAKNEAAMRFVLYSSE